MTYPEYEADLYEIYKSEITGEALFTTAAFLSLDKTKKEKWQLLARLEMQTKQRYLDFVAGSPTQPKYPMGAKIAGLLFGFVFALLPWGAAMNLLKQGTPPLIKIFSRLDENSDAAGREFFSYVLAHEKAIESFSLLELTGNDQSIAVVQEMLVL